MQEVYNGLIIMALVVGGVAILLGLFALYQKHKETPSK